MTANHNTDYDKVKNKTIKTIARAGGGKSTYLKQTSDQLYKNHGYTSKIISFSRTGAGTYGQTLHSYISSTSSERNIHNFRQIMDYSEYLKMCIENSGISSNKTTYENAKSDISHIRHGKMLAAISVWDWMRSVYHVSLFLDHGKKINIRNMEEAYNEYIERFGCPVYHPLYEKIRDPVTKKNGDVVFPARIRKRRTSNMFDFSTLCEIIQYYENWKKTMNYDDYADILLYPLLYPHLPLIPEADVLMIDEAQDCAPIHWSIIWSFACDDRIQEVYLVGDDSQCLYDFTGANPAYLQTFPCQNQSTNGKNVVLPHVYRYGKNIWKNACKFLEKTNTPYSSDHVQPRNHKDYVFDTHGEDGLIKIIKKIPKNERESTAIIVATNSQGKHISRLLNQEIYSIEEHNLGLYDEVSKFPVQTFHKVKGGNFDNALTVFSVPKKWVQRSKDRTEFARMLYVGVTRARKVQINAHNVFPRQVDMDTII